MKETDINKWTTLIADKIKIRGVLCEYTPFFLRAFSQTVLCYEKKFSL